MATNNNITLDQLKRAVSVAEQIETLQAELAGILGSEKIESVLPVTPKTLTATNAEPAPVLKRRGRPPGKGKRTMSPEARAKIAEAQRKRWAKSNGAAAVTAANPAPAKKRKKGQMSPEGRARIAAAQRARWAKTKG